jgi:phosphate transport system permease protein
MTASITIIFLGWILSTLLQRGIATFNLRLLMENTPPPGSSGGLLNAIVGSFMMASLASLIGIVVGVLVVIYFSEYGRNSILTPMTRFINDFLLTSPSVILGLDLFRNSW